MDRPMTANSKTQDVLRQAGLDDYAVLQMKKSSGGNCEKCNHSVVKINDRRCSIKGNKVVNKLAICHHYMDKP